MRTLPQFSPKFVDKTEEDQPAYSGVPIPYIAKTILTAHDAIASLVRWNIALLLAARMREPLSARAYQSIQYPEQCSIGKWLLSEHTLHLRRTLAYRSVLEGHQAFHRQMLFIANLIKSANFTEAERLLNLPDPFLSAFNSLANAIMAMDRIPGGIESASSDEPECVQI